MPSMILIEGTCDAAIIIAVDPERLDTGELHQELAPWNNFYHLVIDKAEGQFRRSDEHCRKQAADLRLP